MCYLNRTHPNFVESPKDAVVGFFRMTGAVVPIRRGFEEAAAVSAVPTSLEAATSAGGVRSVSRALGLLRAMAAPRRSEWSLDELSRVTGLPKATAHRLLNTLVDCGFVEHAKAPGCYRLGLETAVIGSACLQHRRPGDGVRRILEDVSFRVQETVGIGRLSGTDAVSIARVTPGGVGEAEVPTGTILPAHVSAGGKALLAGLGREQALELYGAQAVLPRFTPQTITSFDRLLDHLDRIREQGYAIEDEEYVAGVRCVSVAVPSDSGPPRYSLGIAAPTSRADLTRLRIAVDILEVAASKLTRLLTLPR